MAPQNLLWHVLVGIQLTLSMGAASSKLHCDVNTRTLTQDFGFLPRQLLHGGSISIVLGIQPEEHTTCLYHLSQQHRSTETMSTSSFSRMTSEQVSSWGFTLYPEYHSPIIVVQSLKHILQSVTSYSLFCLPF